jgi:thiol-disulfide isomerase/thioredoxin/protein-disulfide isomerase
VHRDLVTARIVPFALCLIGLMLSGMLVKSHAAGNTKSVESFCGSSCQGVLVSRWAFVPPLPADVAGKSVSAVDGSTPGHRIRLASLGFYYFIFLAAWFAFVGAPSFARRAWNLLPAIAILAACAAGAFLICVMAATGNWCPLCLTTHLVNATLAILVLSPKATVPDPAGKGDSPGVLSLHPSGSLVAAVLAISLLGGLASHELILGDVPQAILPSAAQIADLITPHTGQTAAVAIGNEAALGGSLKAPMTLVVFMDMQCEPCAEFEKDLLGNILPRFHGNLRVVFKHYPLSTDCNPYRDANLHPGACEAAYLAEAARRQGGVADMLAIRPLLQEHGPDYSKQEISQIAASLGIDAERLDQDRHSQAVHDRIRADIELGRQLGVEGTPSLYLDGKPLDYAQRSSDAFWKSMAAAADEAARLRAAGQVAALKTDPPNPTPVRLTNDLLQLGKVVDLSGPTVSGPSLQLKSLRGQPVLLEFWASWCHFCQGEMPNVLKTYDNYHADGLQIVGISLDNNKDDLVKFVGDHKIAWPQIFFDQQGQRGWDNPLAKSFGVQSVPTIVLLDRDGRVVGANLRGNDIAASVARLLGKPVPPQDAAPSVPPSQLAVTPARAIQPGDVLDLGGPTLAGPNLNLSQFRGRPVLLEFWASWCDFCVGETPNMTDTYQKYHSMGLQVVGVSLDNQKTDLAQFTSNKQLEWPQIFFDQDGSRGWNNPLAQKFGVTQIPFIVLIGADGKVRETGLRGPAVGAAVSNELSVPKP